MKKIRFVVVALLTLLLAACAGQAATTPSQAPAEAVSSSQGEAAADMVVYRSPT